MNFLSEWNSLFAREAGRHPARRFRVVNKAGEPLLLLPEDPRSAARCVDLYPAQTARAKLARTVLQWGLRLRLPIPVPKVDLPWNSDAPISSFLRTKTRSEVPEFGVLLGNPRAPGRRFMIMALREGVPQLVVKAATSDRAVELLEAEARFLESVEIPFPGLPKGFERIDGASAFSTAFASGRSPAIRGNEDVIVELLSRWIFRGDFLGLGDVPAWTRVRASGADPKVVASIENQFGATPMVRTIMHGDFSPWNIRAIGNQWTVLDWERGEHRGIPGWDWLHFVIQTQVLVARSTAGKILSVVQALMRSAPFQNYAREAGIQGREEAVLRSYLIHAVYVLRQTEGLDRMQELLDRA